MAGFSELIKNFDKIRDYARDFMIYGYKCRSDYTRKSGRSYDNERRRIESYLAGYIRWETSARGKNLFITTDTGDISENPLFSVWETKSFTTNDCLLHFCLVDILTENPGATAGQAADILHDRYLSAFSDAAMPDTMTVRNKLNEYAAAGLLTKQKNGKTLQYWVDTALMPPACADAVKSLLPAVQFFETVVPAGFLGYFLRRDAGKDLPLFSFRHLFMSQTLDDQVLIHLDTAIAAKRLVQLANFSNRSRAMAYETVIPLKLASNVRHGRRYLLAYSSRRQHFFSYRLDYIKQVRLLEVCADFDQHLQELEDRLPATWGVSLGKKRRLEWVELVVVIDEQAEDYVVSRLKREGKHGTVEKIRDNLFVYRIEVTDTMEMVPWLRTFIGRIQSLSGSNTTVIRQFIADIDRMYNMYEPVEQDRIDNGGIYGAL